MIYNRYLILKQGMNQIEPIANIFTNDHLEWCPKLAKNQIQEEIYI